MEDLIAHMRQHRDFAKLPHNPMNQLPQSLHTGFLAAGKQDTTVYRATTYVRTVFPTPADFQSV
jgi:hypothetical protein